MIYTKSELSKLLAEGVYKVTFVKADGSKREMKCTLLPEVLKPYIEEAEKRKAQLLEEGKIVAQRPENPNVLSVIDMDKNAWRSFKLDTILSVEEIKE